MIKCPPPKKKNKNIDFDCLFNGFDTVGPSPLEFFEGPNIGFNGFWMVFEISREMVNHGLEVNNGLDVNVFGLQLQCAASMNIKDNWQW